MVQGDLIPLSLLVAQEPNLYDVSIRILDGGAVLDQVSTYFGMRKVAVKDGRVLLNNQPLYQRLVLDQGYWPESHLTPPTDKAIREDLEWTKKLGYNGARKHQKLEDPRYYHWADRMGVLVWGEVPSAYEFSDEILNNLMSTLSGSSTGTTTTFHHLLGALNESWGVTASTRTAACRKRRACSTIRPRRWTAPSGFGQRRLEQVETDIFALHDYADTGEKIERHFRDRTRPADLERLAHGLCGRVLPPPAGRPSWSPSTGGIAFGRTGTTANTWGITTKCATRKPSLPATRP